MADFEKSRRDKLSSSTNSVWSLAALSVAACLCSVLGAKMLANAFDLGEIGEIIPRHSAARPVVQTILPPRVDTTITGSIPHKLPVSTVPLTPCGDKTAK